MRVISSAFMDEAALPRRYSCDGEGISPPLAWSDAPAGMASYAVLCDDPDAPSGTWHHWAAYDIPQEVTALEEDAGRHAAQLGFLQGVNDFHRPGYGAACPPHGHGPHRYRFHVLALSVARLPIGADMPCREVERAARAHLLAEAVVTGIYAR